MFKEESVIDVMATPVDGAVDSNGQPEAATPRAQQQGVPLDLEEEPQTALEAAAFAPLSTADEDFIPQDGPSAFQSFFKDTFRQDLWRSQQAKQAVDRLHPAAMAKLAAILELPLTEKLAPTIAGIAKWIAEFPVMRTELPKTSFNFNNVHETHDYRVGSFTPQHSGPGPRFPDTAPPESERTLVTREELVGFGQVCLEAEAANEESREEMRARRAIDDPSPAGRVTDPRLAGKTLTPVYGKRPGPKGAP